MTFNILAPGVMTTHYTFGFTHALSASDELTGALMIAPRQSVTGAVAVQRLMGPGAGGNETIRMRQSSVGVAWSRKF